MMRKIGDHGRSESSESDVANNSSIDLIVVSNREPYVHSIRGTEVVVEKPTGGLTAALDPVVQALGAKWIAWASGEADMSVTDENNEVRVPPNEPEYTLHRVPLADQVVEGYYYGFSNQVLWPVIHSLPSKISPGLSYWSEYTTANMQFANEIIDQATSTSTVWFQDYHFGLAPMFVRTELPNTTLIHFWHPPWPPADVFRVCPHHTEIIESLLSNDLIGFQTDQFLRNFLQSVEIITDGTVDYENWVVTFEGDETKVDVYPINNDVRRIEKQADSDQADQSWQRCRTEYGIDDDEVIGFSAERLDYVKGITYRLRALEEFWATHPEWQGQFTFIQKATKSRSQIPAYQNVQSEVESEVERINRRFGTAEWDPVIYIDSVLPRRALTGLYKHADIGIITPIRDGMNLVTKEFVAASVNEESALIISPFGGVNNELAEDAFTVNPYNTQKFVEMIKCAVTMDRNERRQQMERLRDAIFAHDVYDWAAGQLQAVDVL